MKTIELSTATRSLSEHAKELDDEIIVLTSHNKPIAAIVSLKKVDIESLSLSTNPEFMEIIDKARDEFRQERKISFEDLKREVLK